MIPMSIIHATRPCKSVVIINETICCYDVVQRAVMLVSAEAAPRPARLGRCNSPSPRSHGVDVVSVVGFLSARTAREVRLRLRLEGTLPWLRGYQHAA